MKVIKKDTDLRTIKKQPKLNFNGTHKSCTICDSYTFKQNEILMEKSNYLEFAVIEANRMLMYETYYDALQTYFGQENLQCFYIDTGAFVLYMNSCNFIKSLQNFNDLFDLSNLNKNHDIYTIENEK